VVTYIFNTSGASDRVPVIEFGDFTAVNNSDEPITNFIVNDEEKKRKRTSIKRDNFSKKECKKQGYKPPLPGSVIDLTQLENENLNSPIVKEVAKTLLKICKRDAQKTTGYLMINLLDTSMKIIHDYSNIVIDDPVSAAVDDSRALNNRKDVECEEYEWVDEIVDFGNSADGAVEGGLFPMGTGDKENSARGAVDEFARSTGDLEDDSTGASGAVDAGPVSRTGDLEDDSTGASGAVDAGPVSRTGDLADDSTGAGGAVHAGPVSRTGDLADDSTGAGGAVHAGPVSRTGDLADDSTGSVVDSGQSIDASDLVYAAAGAVGAIQTKGILQDLIMPKNIATDFYLKPVSWCTIRFCDESIRLPNPTNFFCCVNVVVQIVFRISILKDLILGIDDRITGGGVCERDLNFIKQLATLYNKATISGKSVGYYDDVVRTCYMASFYSLDQFKLAATARNRHKSLCTPLVQHCPHELLTLLLGILSNVYKYSSIDHAIPSVLSYNDISEEEINLHGLNAYVLKNTLAKQYFNANNTISPSSEIFKIIVMTTYVCRNCGVSTCSYDVHHELDLHPPSYDFEKGITKLTLAELLDSEFSVKEVRMPCRCTSHLHNGEGVQHDMKYSILRCPIILVSYNYDNYHFS